MNDDNGMRAAFRRADAALDTAPPELHATVRQGRREQLVRRVVTSSGALVVLAILGLVGFRVLGPQVSTVTPVSSPSSAPAAVTPCMTLDQWGSDQNVKSFLDEFAKRRIAGTGADACLSSGAKDTYDGRQGDHFDPAAFNGAGTICLYRCGDMRIVSYRMDQQPQQADANSWVAQMILQISGSDTTHYVETLAIGPGDSLAGAQSVVVRSVTTDVPGPGVFAGTWQASGESLVISDVGRVTFLGVTGHIQVRYGNHANFVIDTTSHPADYPKGTSFMLDYDPSKDVVTMTNMDGINAVAYCGPHATPGTCAA